MEAARMSIDRLMDKEDARHIYHGILFKHQKEQSLAICKDLAGTRKCDAKRSKSEKHKYHMVYSYVEFKKQNKGAK